MPTATSRRYRLRYLRHPASTGGGGAPLPFPSWEQVHVKISESQQKFCRGVPHLPVPPLRPWAYESISTTNVLPVPPPSWPARVETVVPFFSDRGFHFHLKYPAVNGLPLPCQKVRAITYSLSITEPAREIMYTVQQRCNTFAMDCYN